MKRLILVLACIGLFSCSTEEVSESEQQVMEYKVEVSDICDVTSSEANYTTYCISEEEYTSIQSQLENITPGNAGCDTITFKNKSGTTIEAYHKSSSSGMNTCSL